MIYFGDEEAQQFGFALPNCSCISGRAQINSGVVDSNETAYHPSGLSSTVDPRNSNVAFLPRRREAAVRVQCALNPLQGGKLMTRKKVANEAVIAANQKNAQNSTGPNTDQGKAASCLRLSILELHQQCQGNEDRSRKVDLEKVKLVFAKGYVFPKVLFPAAPCRRSLPGKPAQRDRAFRIETGLCDGNKYRWILDLLRNAKNPRDKLFVLAWWLKQENICEPAEILGIDELRRLASRYFGFMSAPEFQYASAVNAWVPYFQRLLQDLRFTGSSSKLVQQGYEPSAVDAALRKRKPASAACEWLARRSGSMVEAPSFANAYSRTYGKKNRVRIQPFIRAQG
jgi:hypothetical protein